MKAFVAVIAALVASAAGARLPRDYASQAAASSRSTATVRAEPIAIVRSVYNAPGTEGFENKFDYAFEAENGIVQQAQGELRTINDAEVVVMKGSYEFVGADSQTYVVEWYADETGFHPSAPHLPKSVEPNHPEVAAAVRAQLEFAAEERAAEASASTRSNAYAAPAQERVQQRNQYAAPAAVEERVEVVEQRNTYAAPAAVEERVVVEQRAQPVRNTYAVAAEPQTTYYIAAAPAPAAQEPIVAVRAQPSYIRYQPL